VRQFRGATDGIHLLRRLHLAERLDQAALGRQPPGKRLAQAPRLPDHEVVLLESEGGRAGHPQDLREPRPDVGPLDLDRNIAVDLLHRLGFVPEVGDEHGAPRLHE